MVPYRKLDGEIYKKNANCEARKTCNGCECVSGTCTGGWSTEYSSIALTEWLMGSRKNPAGFLLRKEARVTSVSAVVS